MDEINDFFDLSKKPAERVTIRGPQTNGVMVVDDEDSEEMFSRDREGFKMPSTSNFDYVKHFKELDLFNTMQTLSMPVEDEKSNEVLDDLTSMGDINKVTELVEDSLYYKKFSIKQEKTQKFTINNMKTTILGTIEGSSVTIIDGPTGCGKTTQVPQWILEDHYHRRQFCNIIVTQPRRIAAISIARRVCEENNFEMGSIVGYQVGLDSKLSKDTRLQYVTTGVLLQKLINNKSMECYTHVILDEVHERNQEMDFLFIVVKKLLLTNRQVKIILMSATFNVEQFSTYFSMPSYQGFVKYPVINIDSVRMFQLKIFHLQMLSCLGALPEINYSVPGISKDMYIFTLKILNAFEFIDSEEEKNNETGGSARPSVLIFLPGIFEIEELYKTLNDQELRKSVNPAYSDCKWWLVPLHSTITTEEQVRVFRSPPLGFRKIILATNIAESSITVPDIKYVIDFCLTKVLKFNPETNFSSLQMDWASQANCKQRAGRAGRVREGRVYRMVHQDFYNTLPEDCIPEMKRCPLDNLVLSAKLLDMGPPVSILALAMDPPDLTNITKTVLNLKQVGAMLKTVSGAISVDDGDITYMGRIMAKLPLDIRFSKLIVLGYIFGCLNDCITMAAAMSVKNVFSTPFQKRLMAYNSKLTWADGSSSDCIAFLNVYKVYQHLCSQNFFNTSHGGERSWAKSAFLQIHAMHELNSLVDELKRRVAREGIVEVEQNRNVWDLIELPLILKFLLAGAFYPYYFTFSHGGETEEREATKLLGGRDPRNTVYLRNMDSRLPGMIYAERVKALFTDCSDEEVVVSFEENTSKVYVTFRNRDSHATNKNGKSAILHGKVALSLYKALKLRQLKHLMNIQVMPYQKSMEYASSLGLCKSTGSNEWTSVKSEDLVINILQPRLPDVDETYIDIVISNMIDCGHFWCQYAEEPTKNQLAWLYDFLNNSQPLVPLGRKPKSGQLCAAPFQESEGQPTMYYRAKIEKVMENNMIWVFYIDYGNNAVVPLNTLRHLNMEPMLNLHAIAFECVLTEISPSIVKDQRAVWTKEAIHRFSNLTRGKKLLGKVFSVAMGVVSLELFAGDLNINNLLIREGYGQVAEETYISKLNKDLRETSKYLQPNQKNALNQQQKKQYNSIASVTIEPPPIKDCPIQVNLKGPFSPLETELHNLMYAGREKKINIDWNSVNSVLLNTDPQIPTDRLLVSACIDQSTSGGHLTLRHTTLLPNIPGLAALLALTFSPSAELRPDASLRHYAALLCGLGHHEGSPLFPEQDMLVPIDVDLTNEDLQNINKLRYHMDFILLTQNGQETPMTSDEDKCQTTKEIKALVQKLISRPRRYREPGSVARAWHWGLHYPDMEAHAINHLGERAIFPPHEGLVLREPSAKELFQAAVDNRKVHQMCKSYLNGGPNNDTVKCPLCQTEEMPLTSMRLHLNSRLHKERESDLPDIAED